MIRFTNTGIVIHGVKKPLYSGSVHYWRMKKENWNKVLDHICLMGFEMIETYIPWSVHEYEEGRFDFGEIDKSKDLDGFLTLCEEKGLYVIVRPGPHINAEMTLFGYPEWILMDEEIQARNPWGTTVVYPYVTKQFPIPSYASEKLYIKAEEYFMRLEPVLKKHAGEKGCILLIQADNETCNFFRDRPYIMDYSEASVSLYHLFLKDRYMEIGALNTLYRSSYGSFEDVPAPRGFAGKEKEDLPYYFDWVEYKEYQILYSLKRMLGIIEKLELGIPVFHNCAYQDYSPISVQREEEIDGLDVAGMDAYPEPGDAKMLRRRIRYLAGSSRLPYVPEFGSGSWFDREVLLTADEEEFGYLYAVMNGLKAVNFYMLAERDRWTGCPVTNDGRVRRKYYDMFQSLVKMMKDNEIHRYERKPGILVLRDYDMGRFRALYSLMDPNILSSNCFIHGPDIPQELFIPEVRLSMEFDDHPGNYYDEVWVDEITEALDLNHCEYNLSDRYLSADKWTEYDVIIASAYSFMDAGMQKRLLEFSKSKGKKLIIGPYIPYLDRNFHKCGILAAGINADDIGAIQVVRDPETFDVRQLGSRNKYTCTNPSIEISVHWDPTVRGHHLLYLANVAATVETAELFYEGAFQFTNVWRGEGQGKDGRFTVAMGAHTVQIWGVEAEEDLND